MAQPFLKCWAPKRVNGSRGVRKKSGTNLGTDVRGGPTVFCRFSVRRAGKDNVYGIMYLFSTGYAGRLFRGLSKSACDFVSPGAGEA